MSRKIVLVTGASRGIGRATALAFAEAGYFVIGTATTEVGADAISDYLSDFEGVGRVLDVTKDESVAALFDEIDSVYGSLQVLVNNAGITKDGLLMRMDDEAFDSVIDANLKSVYRTCRRAIKSMMKARFGRIINISSVVAKMGNAGQTNYAASKAGMEGFSRALAREIGARNVTVNCIAPGFIETDMTDKLDERLIASMLDAIPLARLGQPEDIAAAALFLASDNAGYITGEVLAVNGGMYM